MKFNAAILMVLFLALSGFTWGSSDDEKKVSNDPYSSTSSTSAKKTTKKMKKNYASSMSSNTSQSTYTPAAAPAASGDQRANAIRILTAGDEATRKARMDSLTRLAKSLSAAKQAQASQNSNSSSY